MVRITNLGAFFQEEEITPYISVKGPLINISRHGLVPMLELIDISLNLNEKHCLNMGVNRKSKNRILGLWGTASATL